MKVLGISAGRKNSNNDAMCREALMGAKEVGAEVEFINLQNLHIEHCTGCTACVQSLFSGKGNRCVLKDDFDWLLDKMLDADGIVFSIPIFEKGAAGIFRTITDRFGPRMDRGNNVIANQIIKEQGGKEIDPRIFKDKVISYMGVGGSDWSTRIQCDCFNHALTPMWKVIDNEVFSWSLGIIMNDESVAKAHQIGKNIAEAAGDIENATFKGTEGVCPHCHNRNFYLDPASTHAICCACGMEGDIKVENGKVVFDFPEEQLEHAHDTLSGKFIHADDIKRNEGRQADLRNSIEYKERMDKYLDFIVSSVPNRA
ncbi:MAG: flavodoxin family protein [Eubacterium sp.]|nr:flavodoxin family protein [Eubacterium sp.]